MLHGLRFDACLQMLRANTDLTACNSQSAGDSRQTQNEHCDSPGRSEPVGCSPRDNQTHTMQSRIGSNMNAKGNNLELPAAELLSGSDASSQGISHV